MTSRNMIIRSRTGVFLTIGCFAFLGCASNDSSCRATCSSNVVFRFEPALVGQAFEFNVGGSTAICNRDGCVSQAFQFSMMQNQINSVAWTQPVLGAFHIGVRVDGVSVIDRTLEYRPDGSFELCGKTCNDPVFFTLP